MGEQSEAKPTLVTGWFRRHGIAYLDIMIAALERQGVIPEAGEGTPDSDLILLKRVEQYELAEESGYNCAGKGPGLQALERVVVLLPEGQEALSNTKARALLEPTRWKQLEESVLASCPELEKGLTLLKEHILRKGEFPSLEWFEDCWAGHLRQLWQLIHEAPLKMQLAWYKEYSPRYQANQDRIIFHKTGIRDAEDVVAVTRAIATWVDQDGRDVPRLLVNLYGTSTAVQFGWYYTAWRMPALNDATYMACKDDKGARTRFLAPVTLCVVDRDPISSMTRVSLSPDWYSSRRQQARGSLEHYLRQDDHFSILILGARGTGKSRGVREIWRHLDRPPEKLVVGNCANFADPIHAQSQLFGHEQGAFTGARDERRGLLERAHKGLLFLDEVHHLDKSTRSMLLTAMQAHDGWFEFERLGGSKPIRVKFQPVFASNRTETELTSKEVGLEPDFLDRISQRTIHWPALQEDERMGAWRDVWREMKFKGRGVEEPVDEPEFADWLYHLEIPGNFRDLERIAILAADFIRAKVPIGDEKALFGAEMTLLEYLDRNFRSWGALNPGSMGAKQDMDRESEPTRRVSIPFDVNDSNSTHQTFLAVCRRRFVDAMVARFGSQKAVVEELVRREAPMSPGTLSRWKRGSV